MEVYASLVNWIQIVVFQFTKLQTDVWTHILSIKWRKIKYMYCVNYHFHTAVREQVKCFAAY